MMRFQVLLILIIPIFLVSCATDMSQVKDSDLEWREKNLQIDYQKVYLDTLPNKFGRFSDNGSLKPIR